MFCIAADERLNEVYFCAVNRLVALLVFVAVKHPNLLSNVEHILADLLLSDEFLSGYLALDVFCLWIQ